LVSPLLSFHVILRLVCLFRLLFFYQWGLVPRMGKTHRWERISFVLRVLFPFAFVYRPDFFVLRCLFMLWFEICLHWLNDVKREGEII
jgi:hypothetical protein